MKKLSLYSLMVLGLFIMAGCNSSNDRINEKKIIKECNRMLKQTGQDTVTVNVVTGYYELEDEDSRCTLKRLEAAGLITYNVERFGWWNTQKGSKRVLDHYTSNYSYWYGWSQEPVYVYKKYTNYTFEQHFMVNVALTEAGQALVLNHVPSGIKEEVKDDMKGPDVDPNTFPENQIDCTEFWPEIPHPKAAEAYKKCKEIINEASELFNAATDCKGLDKSSKKLKEIEKVDYYENMTAEQTSDISNSYSKLDSSIRSKKEEFNCNPEPKKEEKKTSTKKKEENEEKEEEEIDPQKAAYLLAKDKEDYSTNILMGYKLKAIKANNIIITLDNNMPTINADVIYEAGHATDAARVLLNTINKCRVKVSHKFINYIDKGLEITDGKYVEDGSFDY